VIVALLAALLLAIVVYAVNVLLGYVDVSQTSGTLQVTGLRQPVQIFRDGRDIPHIRAADDPDLFFAQGFVEGSDRLFQMDLLRRFVFGNLSEVMGPQALAADMHARVVDVEHIVARQWAAMNARDRVFLQAFADGVNAAMEREPLPVEFRLLLYRPRPWRPQDSLAAGMATALDLIDSWDDVLRRDEVARQRGSAPQLDLYSITDPAYDAPIAPADPVAVPRLGARALRNPAKQSVMLSLPEKSADGSNEFAVGARRSHDGNALLANDPHLRVGIPGVWYLVDLRSNDFHAAGASLAGTPGVILGHNDDVAWGATNATVATESVYRDSLGHAQMRREIFHVRFENDATSDYYRTVHGFVVKTEGRTGFAVDWNADKTPRTPLDTFYGLDRAASIAQAAAALRSYPGPPQNFMLADRSGSIAYQMAGLVPDDPLWGLGVHDARDPPYRFIGFSAMPRVAPSKAAVLFTANNRTYGVGYRYRLSPNFAAPYRAARIRALLSQPKRFTIADLAKIQGDTFSAPELEIARATVAALRRKRLQSDRSLEAYAAALAAWNGRFDPQSRGAALAWQLRREAAQNVARFNAPPDGKPYIASANNAEVVLLLRLLREHPRGWWYRSDYDDLLVRSLRQVVRAEESRLLRPWSDFGAVTVRHPLSSLGLTFLNGATFPGDGDTYSIHVQTSNHGQSFRAVWDVGNWDAGGIVIPSGESGEPRSKHYIDQSAAWIAQRLLPLPFSDAAVRRATREVLLLKPLP